MLILKDLLFNYLRTDKNLIYSIDVYSDQTICGTVAYIDVGTQDENVKDVIKEIFYILKELKHNYISDKDIESIKKRYKFISYNRNIKPSTVSNFFIEQYLNQIYMSKPKFYSIDDIMKKVNHINKTTFKSIIKTIFDFNKCLCVYHSNKDLKLNINEFINS
jgi:predicted Zn-dependent peptidase